MHKEKIEFMFKSLDEADISITDFSRLTGISRETLYRWKNGGQITDMLRLRLAYNTAVFIDRGKNNERLPLPSRMKKDERIKLLRSVIKEMSAI